MTESNLRHSHLITEDQLYLQFDDEGKTELIKASNIKHKQGNSYRKVHYTRQDNIGLIKNLVTEVFRDPQWNVQEDNYDNLDPNNGKVVLKRLIKLYPRTNRPRFFPDEKQSTFKVKDPHAVPYFLTEINLFPPSHYKSLFITQDYQQNGLYHIIFNKDGRFETDVVDDWIPVYEETQDPIWGMDINHPWQLVLLKFWAKNQKGYWNVKNGKPFQFIESFTNSNWKYWNLDIQGQKFLNRYDTRLEYGKFICKTKFSNEVKKSGLVQGSAGYELVGLKELNKIKSQKKWLVTLRSTLKNKWTGGMSVVDKQVNKVYENNNYKIRLEKDFLMDHQDFLNLFSGVYVASVRDKHDYYSNYYLIDVPPQIKQAIYIEFKIQKAGFFDFVIKQFPQNKKPFDNQKSRVKFSKNVKQAGEIKSSAMLAMDDRYLKIKYMLVYDNQSSGSSYEYPTKEDQDYPIPRYSAYEQQYSKGYNSGDASFQNVVPGRYILKIKPESIDKNVTLCLNYCSNANLEMKQISPSKEESSILMRQSMISIMTKTVRATLDKNRKKDQVSFGNYFQSIGYGFIAIRSARDNQYQILLEVDPILLQNEGYKLKNQFKRTKQPFGIIIKPGEQNCIVMTKIQGLKSYEWPPRGIAIFKDESQVKRIAK